MPDQSLDYSYNFEQPNSPRLYGSFNHKDYRMFSTACVGYSIKLFRWKIAVLFEFTELWETCELGLPPIFSWPAYKLPEECKNCVRPWLMNHLRSAACLFLIRHQLQFLVPLTCVDLLEQHSVRLLGLPCLERMELSSKTWTLEWWIHGRRLRGLAPIAQAIVWEIAE